MTYSVLISGANRGIGLEFVRQYAADGFIVYACCRQPKKATGLQELATQNAQIQIFPLDVALTEEIEQLAKKLKGKPIDILLNNAGVYGPNGIEFGNVTADEWLKVLQVNTVAPMLMAQAFLSNVQLSQLKIIASITSKMGSIGDNGYGKGYHLPF